MSDSRREVRSRWGGPARLPVALSGLLGISAIALAALVVIGSGIDEAQLAQADPAPAEEAAQPPAQDHAAATPAEHAAPETMPAEPVPAEAAHETAAAEPASHEPVARDVTHPEPASADNSPVDEVTSGQAAAEPAPAVTTPPKLESVQVASAGDAANVEPPQIAAVPPPPAVPTGTGVLPPAPDPGLIEQTSIGPLPRVGDDGRLPWQVYARPFDNRDTRPRIALIMSGLGLSGAATQAAIQGLPGGVSLAFQPFADDLQQWIRLARAAGHEVYLNLPMEPVDFPASDPGPRALFVAYAPEENIERLEWALSRVSGYVGLLNHMGSRFTTSREAMLPIMSTLEHRGLAFVDARVSARSVATVLATEQNVPRAINDRFLDAREVSRSTVDARLAELESIATEVGVSVGIGQAFPVTIERIREWAATLNGKGIVLAPVSAVLDRQADR
ncbi:MAG: divergent polysaccharide deacetylase family protein [Alphaproteobacteria bacterium]|nr:divergent polysaccharide deacetylase family protein [Alphaproteobacteria bacterium]